MAERPPELGTAGESFGRSFCVPPERQGLRFEDLTPEEQSCVAAVGLGWERRIERAFASGGSSGTGGNPEAARYSIRVAGTHQALGTLETEAGEVRLCVHSKGCETLPIGTSDIQALRRALELVGFEVTPES